MLFLNLFPHQTATSDQFPSTHKTYLDPHREFPLYYCDPRSTKGIISSEEIWKRNREKKIETFAVEREHTDQLLEKQVLIPSTAVPEERLKAEFGTAGHIKSCMVTIFLASLLQISIWTMDIILSINYLNATYLSISFI